MVYAIIRTSIVASLYNPTSVMRVRVLQRQCMRTGYVRSK